MPTIPLAAGFLHRVAAVPLVYLLLWCGLVALSVTLVVLVRSRWGQSRTLYKCAVLSLLVHVLLACAAMTVKIVVGDGGSTVGPPIRVRLIDDVPAHEPVAMVPPALLEVEQLEPAQQEPEPEPDEVAAKDEAPEEPTPELVAAPPPEPEREPVATIEEPAPPGEPPPASESIASTQDTPAEEVETPPVATVADAVPTPATPEIQTEPIYESAAADTEPPTPVDSWRAASQPATPVATALPVAASPYALRTDPDRLRLVEQQGGSRDTEAAVAAALRWLEAAQSSDGRWDASRFGAGREQQVLGHNRHGAGTNADCGITALALLAYLGAGHTHLDGNFQPTVRGGLEFLIGSQASDGNLAGQAALYARMYCHAMATFALAEALAMTGDRRLEPAVQQAIGYSLRAQHPATGGWRYRAGDTGDTSQLGWQVMALWSAEEAGIDVAPQTWTGVERFLRSVRRGTSGGLASYRPNAPASTSMTAEALYCHVLLGEVIGEAVDEGAAQEATGQLLSDPPEPNLVNLYYWYYGTLALHHRQSAGEEASAAWQDWNNHLTRVLLDAQVPDGGNAGSWNPSTMWGGYGGRVYSTAMAAMCLEVYYRYAPPRDRWIASRPGAEDPPR